MRQPIPFGKYVLLERISVGGMAEVFKAKSFGVEGFEKILAIKRILPSLAEDDEFITMFIDEAKICGQLNHANICQIFELGRVNDAHFIAMEFVWGKDLLQIQNRFRKLRQKMEPQMAAFVAARMCEGLDYAHKKKDALGRPLNVIHRDISPQNILVSYEGELKIIDFGIAKAATRSSRTQAGVLKGKFGYMSPEQVRGLPLDRRSDIFAIGTILYELLIADRLFVGDSDFETLEKVRNVDIPPPTKLNGQVPEALEKIILRALKREVEDRYQWASEMQEELQAFLMGFDPVFTSKQLSTWMRTQFAAEMKREQEILDEQRKIGREVLGAAPPAAAAANEQVAHAATMALPSLGAPLPAESTRIVEDGDLMEVTDEERMGMGDMMAESTTVSAPPGFAEMIAQAAGEAAPIPEQSTRILSDQQGVIPNKGPEPPPAAPLQAESTVILAEGSGAVPMPPLKASPSRATVMAPMPAPEPPSGPVKLPPVMAPPQLGNPPAGQPFRTPTGMASVPAPLPYAPRSTLWKDILIGVGVAVALVGGVLGARAYFGKGGAKGALVITTAGKEEAEVFVDNARRGKVDAAHPLKIKDLTAGDHEVHVRDGSGAEMKQTVAVAAGDVSVLNAVLAAPVAGKPSSPPPASNGTPTGTGRLKLNVKTEGVTLYLDGAELAPGAWREPITLTAGQPHEVRATKPQREEVRFTLTLQPEQDVIKDIELVPGYGRISIQSDPPGAEVNVNSKHAGVTPLEVRDLDPGKKVRVTIRLKGHHPVVRYVTFEDGLAQTIDAKLTPTGSAPVASAGPVQLVDVAIPDAPKGADKPKRVDKAGKEEDEPGYLVANTQPWAKVIIDGKDTGKTTPIAPRSKIALKPGKHVVTFVANGKKFHFDIVVKPGEDTRLIKQLTDTP